MSVTRRSTLAGLAALCVLACALLAGAPQALAAGMPVVSTGAASAVTMSEANVTGTVNPEGLATRYYYQYGTTTEYGQDQPLPPGIEAGEGSSAEPAPATLFPLTPGVTYHYRLVASNEDGTSYGEDETFTTPGYQPPAVSTGPASEVSPDTATLSGTIDPQGAQTAYTFEYGTTAAYGSQIFGEADPEQGVQTVTLALQSLLPGTTYHYRLLASNSGGSTDGVDQTFTTPGIPSPIVAPITPPLIATPGIAFPVETTGTTKPPPKKKANAKKKKPKHTHRTKGKGKK